MKPWEELYWSAAIRRSAFKGCVSKLIPDYIFLRNQNERSNSDMAGENRINIGLL